VKLASRLLIHGAVLPAVVIGIALLTVGWMLDRLLRDNLDQALLAQATVESVSLFDRMDHVPHLHLDRSPLRGMGGHAAAVTALYNAAGERLVVVPQEGASPRTVAIPRRNQPPQWRTETTQSGEERVLAVVVPDPEGALHTLRLALSLERHAATMATYWRLAGTVGTSATFLLLVLQLGLLRWLAQRLQRLRQQIGQLHGQATVLSLTDDGVQDELTEVRHAVEQAAAALGRTRQAQERLLADAAHELRTPLAAIRTDVDVTLRRERPAAELVEALQRVRQEVTALGDLAQRLLDLTVLRLQGGPSAVELSALGEVDLRAVCQAVVAQVQPRAHVGHVSVTLQGPETLMVRGDESGLRQVLANLLDNALRHAPAGSVVVVQVGQELALPGLPMAAKQAALWVDDAGPGIAPADRERVFEPLHRLDRRGSGAGLGLAIVREVAHRHGGEAFASESASGGARVGIYW
jgi:signal transduction histidine kinase